jgi:hypothetical protein
MGRWRKGITISDRLDVQIFHSPDGCWYWLGCTYPSGYGSIYYKDRIEATHRVSYKLYKGEIPKGIHVLHKCDNRLCINPDHLFLGTNTDNVKDKVSKNRQYRPFGIKCPKAKLDDNKVKEIRSLKGIECYLDIAKKFNVSPSHIHKIWRNEFWIQTND